MPSLKILQIIFSCSVNKNTDAKTRSTLQRKMGAASVHKGISGFFLAHGDTYLGVFEGPDKKVLAQIEGVVRKEFVTGLTVISECEIDTTMWDGWFRGKYALNDLPEDWIARMPGLAQIIADTLDAGQD